MQAYAGMQPGDHQQHGLQYSEAGQQHPQCCELGEVVAPGAEYLVQTAGGEDVSDQRERDEQPEHSLRDLPRRHAQRLAQVQRPQHTDDVDQGGTAQQHGAGQQCATARW